MRQLLEDPGTGISTREAVWLCRGKWPEFKSLSKADFDQVNDAAVAEMEAAPAEADRKAAKARKAAAAWKAAATRKATAARKAAQHLDQLYRGSL